MTFDEAVKILERRGRVSYSGESSVRAQCVAHDDYNPSLSVGEGENGRLLVHCFAGCKPGDVLAALERLADPTTPLSERQQREIRSRVRPEVAREVPYELRDLNGRLVAVHVRQEDAAGNKLAVYWRGGLKGRRRESLPLFGSEYLKDIPLDETLIVTEGEKDCLALWAKGVLAVATVCGAGTIPSDEVLRCLVGRRVKLWRDKDKIGQQHMQRIAARLLYLNRRKGDKA